MGLYNSVSNREDIDRYAWVFSYAPVNDENIEGKCDFGKFWEELSDVATPSR